MHQAIDCMFHGSEASRDLFFSVGTPYLHARRRVAYVPTLHSYLPSPASLQHAAASLLLNSAYILHAAAPQQHHHYQKFNFTSFRSVPLISFMRRAESVDSLHAPIRDLFFSVSSFLSLFLVSSTMRLFLVAEWIG